MADNLQQTGVPDRSRIDIGGESADHPSIHERADPRERRRGGDTDPGSEGVVRDPPVAYELGEDARVHAVEWLNILRSRVIRGTHERMVFRDSPLVMQIFGRYRPRPNIASASAHDSLDHEQFLPARQRGGARRPR